MRDRSGSATIAERAAPSLPVSKIHRTCGKFCGQVSFPARKALWDQPFQSFEPERGNRLKSSALNDLTRQKQNCGSLISARRCAREFYKFSTIDFIGGACG